MDGRDVLDHATREIGALLAEAGLPLQLPPQKQVDSPETQSVYDTAGYHALPGWLL